MAVGDPNVVGSSTVVRARNVINSVDRKPVNILFPLTVLLALDSATGPVAVFTNRVIVFRIAKTDRSSPSRIVSANNRVVRFEANPIGSDSASAGYGTCN